MSVVPVVLDVDTGVDDACALLLAARHPGVELVGVSCVAGNASLADVMRNTLTVLDAADRADVPVARGADRPLLASEPSSGGVRHGADGMGDVGWPAPGRKADPRPAVELLRDVLLGAADAGRPATLVALGPLTNVALLLRAFPEVAPGLARIRVMGGAAFVDDATAAGDFNLRHDPEAAAIVLRAAASLAVPVTLYGLDVFFAPRVRRPDAEGLAAATDPAARLAGLLMRFQCDRVGADEGTIGDAGAVCALLEPSGLVTRTLPVRIELTDTATRGRTVIDRDHPDAVVDLAVEVDGERYASLWLATMTLP